MGHIRLFESFVRTTEFDKLSDEEQADICENIYDHCEYLRKEYWNVWTFLEALRDEPNFKIPLIKLKVEPMQHGALSDTNLEKIRKLEKLNPVLASHGKFFDGGHRMKIAAERGMKTINAFEIGQLLDFDWEKWAKDETVKLP